MKITTRRLLLVVVFTMLYISMCSIINAQSIPTLSGRVTDGHGHGIPDVQVTLYYQGDPQWGGQRGPNDTWVYTDSSGYYSLPVTIVDYIYGAGLGGPTVTVTLLAHVSGIAPAAAAMKSARAYSYIYVSATTPVLQNIPGTLNIDLSNNQGIKWTTLPNINDLDDFAVMYLHTNQALQCALTTLNMNMDYGLPVEVYGDMQQGTGTWYSSPSFQLGGWGRFPSSAISIDAADNGFMSGNRPDNREWHEFSHHIMADSLIGGDNALPPLSAAQDMYHAGYFANSDTVAGWTEGFAEFMSCEIATRYPAYSSLPLATPILGTLSPYPPQWYGGWGNPRWWDLEWQTDLRGPTRLNEEFAIASILWDLEDPINQADNDSIDLTMTQLWNILNQNTAPGTGGNRNTLRDVYEALMTFASGSAVLQANIDRIFIAHGAFDDVNGNSLRDAAEAVGFSGDAGRPGRRNTPYLENSFIHVTVLDAETLQEVEVDGFLVQDLFAPPHEYLNADFVVSYFDDIKDSIYFSMAPFPSYSTTAFITPIKAGYCDPHPLIITNSFYWDRIENSDHIIHHTFYLNPGDCNPMECVNPLNCDPHRLEEEYFGDLNDDGEITPEDALIAFNCYLGLGPCPDMADVNQDGAVTPADARCLLRKYLEQSSH
ncbi:MAG: dockerin type I domain-containing protein [bacterium]